MDIGTRSVVSARSYKTLAQAGASADKASASTSASSSAASTTVSVRELFKPPPQILALLPSSSPQPFPNPVLIDECRISAYEEMNDQSVV